MRSQLKLVAHYAPQAQPEALRILIAGRDALARRGLISILGAYDDVAVVDDFDADERLASRARVLAPDVLVGDLAGDGAALLDAVRRADCASLILISDPAAAGDAIVAGARGVILRSAASRRLHAAVRAVGDGMLVLDEEIPPSILAHVRPAEPLPDPLTARELEVMQLLAAGMTNKEIALRLGISDHTVKFHVNAILGKFGVATRTEAVVQAAKMGIVAL